MDYARAEDGARAIVSDSDGLHTAVGLINGVADAALWNKGEGWQVTWERERMKQGWSSLGYLDRLSRGAAWAEVRFDRPRRVNRVVIHGYNTELHPFEPYREGALQVRRPADLPGVWTTVGRIENQKVIVPGHGFSNVSPKTTFRFNMVEVEAVRFVVYQMAAAATSAKQTFATRYQNNTLSLLEIEVTGTDTVDPATVPPSVVAVAPGAPTSLMDKLKGPGLDAPAPSNGDQAVAPAPRPADAAVGAVAPTFKLATLSGDLLDLEDYRGGDLLDLEDYRGKVVLLNFWATWCGPCVKEIPDLVQLSHEMASRDVAVLGISVDSTGPDKVRTFADRYGVDYPVAVADRATRALYGGIPSIPTTFIIDANGLITRKIVGMQSKEAFMRYVESALAN